MVISVSNIVKANVFRNSSKFNYFAEVIFVNFSQDALGGNSNSCMIVNLAPEQCHILDTFSALQLARKTRTIVNTVATNVTGTKHELVELSTDYDLYC